MVCCQSAEIDFFLLHSPLELTGVFLVPEILLLKRNTMLFPNLKKKDIQILKTT